MAETIGAYLLEAAGVTEFTAATATFVGSAAIQTTLVVANYAYQQQQQRKAQAAMADMLSRDKQLTTVRATAAIRKIVLGRLRVGGTLMFAFVTGEANEYLHLGVEVAGHEIDAIEDVLFNDESLGALDGSSTTSGGGGFVTAGKYARESNVETVHVATMPALGNYIAMPAGTVEVVSIAPNDSAVAIMMPDGSEATAFVQGVHYEVTSDSPPQVKNLDADHADRTIIVTIRKRQTRPLVRVKKFLGLAAGERDTDLEAECAAAGYGADGFASTDLGKGIARIHVRLEMDQTVFGTVGIPNITMLVRGAKARDWATGATSWTRNAARLIAWYVMRPEGFNASVSDFDGDLALDAQNVCDEIVATTNSVQARYTLDGVIYPDADPLQTLSMMQTAMAGEVVPVGGTWDLRAGAWDPPTFTITDDMLTGEAMSVQPARSRDRKFNSVRGKFSDPEILYNDNDIPPYASETYIAQDGGVELWTDIDLPYTTDAEAAQRIQRIYLHKERNPLAFRCTVNMRAYQARAGQNVYVKASAYGWETLNDGLGKIFHITRRSMRIDGLIELTMIETAPEIFNWTYDEATLPDPTPDTGWPRWDYVDPVRGLACSTSGSTYLVDGDGNVVPYASLTWTPPIQSIYADAVIVTRWKKATETSYREERASIADTGVLLRGVAAGDVVTFGVQVVMPNGARSETVFGTHTASTTLPPQGVPAASIETGGNDIQSSDLAFGVDFLTLYYTNLGSDAVSVTQNVLSSQRISGTPTNALIVQQGTQTGGYVDVAWPTTIAVRPSERRGLRMLLHPYGTEAYAWIKWLKSDGTASSHPADYGSRVTDAGPDNANLVEGHTASTWIGNVPADATAAEIHIHKDATKSGTWSFCSITQPQFHRLSASATDVPPYSSGPNGKVGTTQLESQAATVVISGSTAAGTIADGGTIYCTAASAFTAPRDCKVVVSASVSLDLQANTVTGTPTKQGYGMRIEQSDDGGSTWSYVRTSSGGVEPTSAAGGHVLDLAIGARRGVSLAIPACIVSLTSGTSSTFRARLALERGVQAIAASDFSITVQAIKA